MKITFTFCFIALSVLACQKSAVSPVHEHNLISSHTLQSSNPNAAFTSNSQFDVDLAGAGFIEFNSCDNGILQVVGGSEHIDLHEAFGQTNASIVQHNNIQSVKLVNPTTGAEYTGSGTSDISQSFSLANGKQTVTATETVMATTAGGKNNSVLKFDLHETFDANGNVTAFVDNFRSGCK